MFEKYNNNNNILLNSGFNESVMKGVGKIWLNNYSDKITDIRLKNYQDKAIDSLLCIYLED